MSSDRSAYIIGITGGIATGKSTAASILVPALNAGGARAFLVDCDKVSNCISDYLHCVLVSLTA